MNTEHGKERDDMNITDAAKIIGVTPQFLRIALQQEKFPFGVAIKTSTRWTYYINETRLKKYLDGKE